MILRDVDDVRLDGSGDRLPRGTGWADDAATDGDTAVTSIGRAKCDVRHRVYLPQTGRWTRRDPLGYVDGMSEYEYVRSGPMDWRDVAGTRAERVRVILLGGGDPDEVGNPNPGGLNVSDPAWRGIFGPDGIHYPMRRTPGYTTSSGPVNRESPADCISDQQWNDPSVRQAVDDLGCTPTVVCSELVSNPLALPTHFGFGCGMIFMDPRGLDNETLIHELRHLQQYRNGLIPITCGQYMHNELDANRYANGLVRPGIIADPRDLCESSCDSVGVYLGGYCERFLGAGNDCVKECLKQYYPHILDLERIDPSRIIVETTR